MESVVRHSGQPEEEPPVLPDNALSSVYLPAEGISQPFPARGCSTYALGALPQRHQASSYYNI